MRTSTWKLLIAAPLSVLACVGCAQNTVRVVMEPPSCHQAAPASGQLILLRAEVIGFEEKNLHVDFEDFGTDFSSVEVRFREPPPWDGIAASIYFQGEPVFRGETLREGASIEFSVVPPACLDQPWLFLSSL